MKSTSRKLLAVAAAFAAIASASSVHAITFILDGSVAGGGNSGGNNNTRTFAPVSGVSLSVKAYSLLGSSSTYTQSFVGQYLGNGLGVTNDNESGNDPEHKVDNVSSLDYLLLTFSQSVTVQSFELRSVGDDSDIRVWIGNSTNPATLDNGLFEDSLTSSSNNRTATITTLGSGTSILVGATSLAGYVGNDEFKLYSVTVTQTPNTPGVPDGGSSVVLLGAALASLGLIARRKIA